MSDKAKTDPKGPWKASWTVEGAAVGGDPLAEARKKGQPLGALANKEKAERFSRAIVRLAKTVWDHHPELKNNLSATARAIEEKHDNALKLGPHSYLGHDAIRKHLSKHKRGALRETP